MSRFIAQLLVLWHRHHFQPGWQHEQHESSSSLQLCSQPGPSLLIVYTASTPTNVKNEIIYQKTSKYHTW